MNVTHLLIAQSAKTPYADAIIEGSGSRIRRITFGELDDRSARAAAMLKATSIGAGQRVLVFVPMSIELYVALIALFRIGAIAVILDPSAGREHFSRGCQIAKPTAFIAIAKAHLLRLFHPTIRRIPHRFSVGPRVPGAASWNRCTKWTADRAIADRSDNDAALLTFTSGSTARPKAAVRSHGFLAAQHAALASAIELKAGEIDLATLPIFTLANLASGVTSVIPDADLRRPAAVKTSRIISQLRIIRPTRCVASPAFFQRMLDDPAAGQPLQHLRQIYTGGAPVFPGFLARLQAALPQTRIVAVYGSTEAEPIADIVYSDMSERDIDAMYSGRGLLTGKPVPEIRLRILNDEILVTGDHVLKGYLDGEDDAETKLPLDGAIWHRTGDAGYLDGQGRLWLLGRISARIVDDRGTLYPFAVECAASQTAGIRRTALIAHQGRRFLFVEGDRSAVAILCEKLAWARLNGVRWIRRIPVDKRHNSKVDYPALKKSIVGR